MENAPSGGGAPAPSAPSTSAPSSTPSQSAKTSTPASTPSQGRPQQLTAAQFRQNLLRGGRTPEVAPETPAGLSDFEAAPEAAPEEQSAQAESVAMESPEATEVEDYSWADQIKDYRQLHGLELQEVLQALANGQIPEALWDKLRIPLKDGDEEWEDTIGAARDGAMMRHNFTKKAQALAQERDAFHKERTDLIDYMKGWKEDPRKLLAGLRKLGMPYDAMARAYAEEVAQFEHLSALEQEGKLPPGTAKALQQKQELEAQLEEQRVQIQRAQAQQQTQQTDEQAKQIGEQVKTHSVQALNELGYKLDDGTLTEGVWEMYKTHLQAVWNVNGGQAPSRMQIREAARATKSQVDAYLRKAAPASAPTAPKLGAAALDGGAPRVAPKVTSNGRPKQVTSAEFRKKMMNGGPFGR